MADDSDSDVLEKPDTSAPPVPSPPIPSFTPPGSNMPGLQAQPLPKPAAGDPFTIAPQQQSDDTGFPKFTPEEQKHFQELRDRHAQMQDKLYDREMEVLNRPEPPIPQTHRLPNPPKPGIDREGAMQWFAAASTIGALFGAVGGRNGSMNAMSAFTGMMKGLKQGNDLQYLNASKEWVQQAEQAKDNNQQEWDRYKAIMQRKDLDSKQIAMMIDLEARKYQNNFVSEVARKAMAGGGDLSYLGLALDTGDKQLMQYALGLQKQKQAMTDKLYEIREGAKIREQVKDQAEQGRAKDIVDAIAEGRMLPTTGGYGTANKYVRAEMARRTDVDFGKLQLQAAAAQSAVRNMNSSQRQTFFAQAGNLDRSINDLKQLSEQLKLRGIPIANEIELKRLTETQAGTPLGQLAGKYIAAATNVESEMAQIERGGYAPTESSWDVAHKQVRANYSTPMLEAQLDEVRKLIGYRVQAFQQLVPGFAPGSSNPYLPGAQGPLPNSDGWSDFEEVR